MQISELTHERYETEVIHEGRKPDDAAARGLLVSAELDTYVGRWPQKPRVKARRAIRKGTAADLKAVARHRDWACETKADRIPT